MIYIHTSLLLIFFPSVKNLLGIILLRPIPVKHGKSGIACYCVDKDAYTSNVVNCYYYVINAVIRGLYKLMY